MTSSVTEACTCMVRIFKIHENQSETLALAFFFYVGGIPLSVTEVSDSCM